MRNLLAFMMALVLTVAAAGWYLDWFRLRTTPGTDGHTTLNVDINSAKAYTDVAKGVDKLKEFTDKKAKEETDKAEAAKKAETDKAAAQNPPVKSNSGTE